MNLPFTGWKFHFEGETSFVSVPTHRVITFSVRDCAASFRRSLVLFFVILTRPGLLLAGPLVVFLGETRVSHKNTFYHCKMYKN